MMFTRDLHDSTTIFMWIIVLIYHIYHFLQYTDVSFIAEGGKVPRCDVRSWESVRQNVSR